MEAKQDEDEEDDGEDPRCDAHEKDPAERRQDLVRPGGYQRPGDQAQKLDKGKQDVGQKVCDYQQSEHQSLLRNA